MNRKLTIPKKYRKLFEREERKYGREIAVYNLGFLVGDEKRKKKAMKHVR